MKRLVSVVIALIAFVVLVSACAPTSAPAPVSNTSAPPAPATALPATAAPAATTAPAATSAPTTAPQAADVNFPKKDVTFIIPVSPGGGFDTNARILAPYLKKYLPGTPNVVPQNVPGGEWRLGIMQMLKSPPDGSTISIFNIPGNVLGQVTNSAEYDLNKVPWIGRITDTVYLMALSPKSKYKTLDDLKKATEVKSSVVGLTSSSALAVMFTAAEMGFKVKMINYDGSTEAIMAAIQGDVDFVIYPFPSLQKFVVGSTDLTPFVVFGKDKIKELPNTPSIVDMGYPNLLTVVALDYDIGTVPGTPDSILKIWRDSFAKAVADPDFVKMMSDQLKRPPVPLDADKTAKSISDSLTLYGKYKDLVMQYVPK